MLAKQLDVLHFTRMNVQRQFELSSGTASWQLDEVSKFVNAEAVRVTSVLDRRVGPAPCADAGERPSRSKRLRGPVAQHDRLGHCDPVQATIWYGAIFPPNVSSQRYKISVSFERIMPA